MNSTRSRRVVPAFVGALALLAAAILAAPPASSHLLLDKSSDGADGSAFVAQPLAGTGENIEPIAHFSLGFKVSELELAGNYAYVAHGQGLAIVDISRPAKPKLAGRWECIAGWGDVDVSVDGNLVVLVNALGGSCDQTTSQTGVVLIDATDKSHPILLATIENDAESEYVHTATLDGTRLFLNPANWLGYPQQHFHVPVYDVSNPLAPERLAFIEFPAPSVAHDTFVDHRPDGRTLLYSASIHTTDIFDITDVGESTRLQTSAWPEIQLSHQAEPSFDRKLVVVGDEAVSSFSTNPPSVCGRVEDRTLANVDVGSIHFFVASPDGTMADQGTYEIGSFNIPPTVVDGVCSAHVFWQAPDERRLSAAWYSAGARIVDFGNPAAARELGWFIPEPQAMYWSVKPHCGYLFATDLDRGLDILRYTGEGGRRWPATSGPAEVERAQHQGAPAPAAKCRLR